MRRCVAHKGPSGAFVTYCNISCFFQKYNLKLLTYEAGPGLENSRINDDEVTKHAVQFNAHGFMEDALTDVLETWNSLVNQDPYNTFPGKEILN